MKTVILALVCAVMVSGCMTSEDTPDANHPRQKRDAWTVCVDECRALEDVPNCHAGGMQGDTKKTCINASTCVDECNGKQ